MTKVPQGFDFSFLSEEEARKILQVLERNEELQRAEKDRIRYRANSFLFSWAWVQQLPGVRGSPGARRARDWRGAFAGHLSRAGRCRAASSRQTLPRLRVRERKSARRFSLKDSWNAWLVLCRLGIPDGLGRESGIPQDGGAFFRVFLSCWVPRSCPTQARDTWAMPWRLGSGR